ncbi:MAG: aminotransferase class III-fold pyridoxal phosphate-dependent enzyme [Bacteroidia bacterium]|nr:aminotransferase class III-fold pyridoxal phosphate-dependent enzyme [Bacteroidia bacterium]
MNLFDVYPLFNITPVRAKDCQVYDEHGTEYLDLYGGHAVISIGHAHPHYAEMLKNQIDAIGFYSNSVQNPLQQELADKLGEQSCLDNYKLFLCNSGAEANENALKVASFHTGRAKVLYLERAFHGRTSAAVAVTDNPKVVAPVNKTDYMVRIAFDDEQALTQQLETGEFCALIVEGIQGVGGIHEPSHSFLKLARKLCTETGTVLILDEIQSGYGRSGMFFAHQHAGIRPDIVSMAKGMGNGFPIGGILLDEQFEAWHGMLGTTFGGNHLACAAGIAVLDVLKSEDLIAHADRIGKAWIPLLESLPGVKEVRGRGLMLGVELDRPAGPVRKQLLDQHRIFTGSSSQPNVIRLLPPLTLTMEQVMQFQAAAQAVLEGEKVS